MKKSFLPFNAPLIRDLILNSLPSDVVLGVYTDRRLTQYRFKVLISNDYANSETLKTTLEKTVKATGLIVTNITCGIKKRSGGVNQAWIAIYVPLETTKELHSVC